MPNNRKRYTSEYKVKIVLEILSNTWTIAEIANKYWLQPTMLSIWKTKFLERSKEIFNTDQWSQFTSNIFTNILEKNNIKISMDSKWRYADNIFIERLWRSIKQEEVYLKIYNSPIEAIKSIWEYILFYNSKRPHQSLWYKTPLEVYENSIKNLNFNSKIIA